MEATLTEFLSTGVFAFILTFVRLGSAFMIMPGLGDSFVPERIRLWTALSISFVLMPITADYLPAEMPSTFGLVVLVFLEFLIGLFFGTIARIFMMATDTAGMVISTMSGLGSAQVFNPSLATQGSLVGAFLSITGVTLLFTADLHHLLIAGALDSYQTFPVQEVPDLGSMAEFVAKVVSASFAIGVKMSAPFIVLTLLMYVGMGVLSRVMPQVQVFMLALPLQVLLSVILMGLSLSALFAYWLSQFEQGMIFLLSP
ncbi:MAG: flagellar biosynthetic protein FliR [Alphaproteobacteria bacterium]|nr:flagellar biosynthetic protein FliR [Alphaproteobacteria bacterium]|tara:strand:+ start:8834 stop:9604 length:771 start_codon:yes stop_codon:yes gene_type:complete